MYLILRKNSLQSTSDFPFYKRIRIQEGKVLGAKVIQLFTSSPIHWRACSRNLATCHNLKSSPSQERKPNHKYPYSHF